MKYDLMLIGPATRDINIDYTGQEVREIGGAVFFCAYAAAAASANLFASVKIHPDDTDVLDAFHAGQRPCRRAAQPNAPP